jgi:hypothetical protein
MKTKLDTFFQYLWAGVFAALMGGLLAFVYVMKTGGF